MSATHRGLGTAAAALCLGLGATGVPAQQQYPARAIRIVVPFAPGATADFVARVVGQELSERLRQDVITENRPGPGGIAGTDNVKSAPADGHTLLVADVGTFAIAPFTYAGRLPYKPKEAFDPIVRLASVPYVLAVHPRLDAKDVKGLVELAKRRANQFTYASSGVASLSHLGMELLKAGTGMSIIHVPYKGSGAAIADLLAGHVALTFAPVAAVQSHVAAHRLRALAVASNQRALLLPDVQTMREAAFTDVLVTQWIGLAAPRTTSAQIVGQLNKEIQSVLSQDVVKKRLEGSQLEIGGGSPGDFARLISSESDKWEKVVRVAAVRAE